jgi:hypothetical protein
MTSWWRHTVSKPEAGMAHERGLRVAPIGSACDSLLGRGRHVSTRSGKSAPGPLPKLSAAAVPESVMRTAESAAAQTWDRRWAAGGSQSSVLPRSWAGWHECGTDEIRRSRQQCMLNYALVEALGEFADEGGRVARFKRYAALAGQVRPGLAQFGIDPVVAPEQSSVVLRSYKLPTGTTSTKGGSGL